MRGLVALACMALIGACGGDSDSDDSKAGGTESTGSTDSTGATDATDATESTSTTDATDSTGTDSECAAFAAGAGSGYNQGETMVNMELKNCAGEVVKISDLLCKKKAVLMDFGAGWCTACREKQPELLEWHDEYGPEGLEIVVILREDAGPADPATSTFCQSWRDEYSLPFQVLIDPTDKYTGKFLGGGGATFPMEVLVTKDWKIVLKEFGYSADTEVIIQDVLGL